jgi:hypothetical protein
VIEYIHKNVSKWLWLNSKADILHISRVLREAGINQRQTRLLMEKWILGENISFNENKFNIPSTELDLNNQTQIEAFYKIYVSNHRLENWWITIAADDIKPLFSNYDEEHSEIVHKASTELADIFFIMTLKENPIKKVVLTAWWPWSGKSTILVNALEKSETPSIVFDWTWAWRSWSEVESIELVKNYELAKRFWKDVEIHWLLTNLDNALLYASKRKRQLPEAEIIKKHQQVIENLIDIIRNRPDILVKLTLNTWTLYSGGTPKAIELKMNENIYYLQKVQSINKHIISDK